MTAFQPTTRTIDPPPEEDALGSAVVAALSRDVSYLLTMNWWLVLLLGLATAGLAPLFVLLLRLRTFATAQKFQLEHVTEWLEKTRGHDESMARATHDLRKGWGALTLAGLALAVAAFLLAVAHLWRLGLNFEALLSLFTLYRTAEIGAAYGLLVGAGFLACHCIALQLFANHVDRFLESVHAEKPPKLWAGITPIWLVCGIALTLCGVVWGLPMMLAGGAHRRYITDISRFIRTDLAKQVDVTMRDNMR